MRLLLILAALLLPAVALADDVTVHMKGLKKGERYEFAYNADGSISVNPIQSVTVGQGPGPRPTDPTPTDPDEDKEIRDLIARYTTEAIQAGGTKESAAALSSVFSLTADAVKAGTVKPDQVLAKLSQVTSAVMAFQNDRSRWTTWRDGLSEILNTAESQGRIRTAADWEAALRLVAAGINQSIGFDPKPLFAVVRVPFADAHASIDHAEIDKLDATDGKADGIFDGIDLDKIMKLIELIMRLLEIFRGPM